MAPSNKAAFDGVPGFCCNVEDTHRLVGSGIWGKDTVEGGGGGGNATGLTEAMTSGGG